MSTDIIAALAVIGYIIITAIVMGLAERKQSDVGVFFAFLWPLGLVALAMIAVGYFPYKIARDSFKRKED